MSSGAFPRISLFLVSSRNDGDREERGRERWQERIAVEEQELDKITFRLVEINTRKRNAPNDDSLTK